MIAPPPTSSPRFPEENDKFGRGDGVDGAMGVGGGGDGVRRRLQLRVRARAVHHGRIRGMSVAVGVPGTGGTARRWLGRREALRTVHVVFSVREKIRTTNVGMAFVWVGGGWSFAPLFSQSSQGVTRSRSPLAEIESGRWTEALFLPTQRTYINPPSLSPLLLRRPTQS